MKITIERTTKTVTFNGLPARIWEGHTESGIQVICFITRVAVPDREDQTQFERELAPMKEPSAEAESFPLRMIL
jgi:hypothetical protein